jgi:hypothetical protein
MPKPHKIEVFFNRPDAPINLDELWNDMMETKNHLVLASAWFTDTETANVFVKSPATNKTIILNSADVDRGDKKAVAILRAYDKEIHEKGLAHMRAYEKEMIHKKALVQPYQPYQPNVHFYILGSGNWQQGVMHHKFILCDCIVWIGSFNFTFQARKNYETLLRVQNKSIVDQFYGEVNRLDPYYYNHAKEQSSDTFMCQECRKVLSWKLLGEDNGYGSYICHRCFITTELPF